MPRQRPRFHLAVLFAALWFFGCKREGRKEPAANEKPGQTAAVQVAANVGDTEIVRTTGVPTDADDTLPNLTRKSAYRKAPRIPPIPECTPKGHALCIEDTAAIQFVVPCCIAPQRLTNWLIFASDVDSIQTFTSAATFSMATLSHARPTGSWKEKAANDGSWLRFHFPSAGTYVLEEMIESDDSVAYDLRVIPVVATGATRPIGSKAQLVLVATKKAMIAIVPASIARGLPSNGFESWAVSPGSYAALMVRDTTYVACKLPCETQRPFTMKAGQRVTLTF